MLNPNPNKLSCEPKCMIWQSQFSKKKLSESFKTIDFLLLGTVVCLNNFIVS